MPCIDSTKRHLNFEGLFPMWSYFSKSASNQKTCFQKFSNYACEAKTIQNLRRFQPYEQIFLPNFKMALVYYFFKLNEAHTSKIDMIGQKHTDLKYRTPHKILEFSFKSHSRFLIRVRVVKISLQRCSNIYESIKIDHFAEFVCPIGHPWLSTRLTLRSSTRQIIKLWRYPHLGKNSGRLW